MTHRLMTHHQPRSTFCLVWFHTDKMSRQQKSADKEATWELPPVHQSQIIWFWLVERGKFVILRDNSPEISDKDNWTKCLLWKSLQGLQVFVSVLLRREDGARRARCTLAGSKLDRIRRLKCSLAAVFALVQRNRVGAQSLVGLSLTTPVWKHSQSLFFSAQATTCGGVKSTRTPKQERRLLVAKRANCWTTLR